MSFIEVDVNVPVHSHDKLIGAISSGGPVSIKLDLMGPPKDRLYVTAGQKVKIAEAISKKKHYLSLRFSKKQVHYNTKSEGGFLAGILSAAARFLPSILAGLLAGEVESHTNGNGLFLGRKHFTYQLTPKGKGLCFEPVEDRGINGLYVRNGIRTYRGRGILHDLFGKIPLLNLIV